MSRPDALPSPPAAAAASSVRSFARWFWRPPRAHGEIEVERRVSFLELFSDLVYVVVISQAARVLASAVSVRGYLEFLVVFGVIWVAWANGTLYYELHGREDGRTRTFVFLQMAILALLAVFTGEAAGATGTAFAVVYLAFLGVMTWLWYAVRRQDRAEYMATTARYIAAMVVSMVVIAASAVLPTDARLVVWAGFTLGWLALMLLFGRNSRRSSVTGIVPTDAMVERFDLLVIIVLGEVVVGVVNGLSGADHDPMTLATGFLALMVGFGLWWIFFDVGGRRLPRFDGLAVNAWMAAHLPIAIAIIGAGAAMVSLIAHAHDPQTPAPTAWLLAGSVALGTHRARPDDSHARRLRASRGDLPTPGVRDGRALRAWRSCSGGARPTPWLLALLLAAILAAIWLFAVVRLFKTGTWTASGAVGDGGRAASGGLTRGEVRPNPPKGRV